MRVECQPQSGPHRVAGSRRDHDPFAVTGGLRRTQHLREAGGPVPLGLDELEQVGSPPFLARGPVAGPGSVATIGDRAPAQSVREPVVGLEHRGDARERLGLGAAQPRQLRDRGRRCRARSRTRPPTRPGRVPRRNRSASTVGGVVPTHACSPDEAASFVEHHQSRLLRRDRDRGHAERPAGVVAGLDERLPPDGRVLVDRPDRLRRVRDPSGPEEPTVVGVAQLHCRRMGRRVDSQYERHGWSPPRRNRAGRPGLPAPRYGVAARVGRNTGKRAIQSGHDRHPAPAPSATATAIGRGTGTGLAGTPELGGRPCPRRLPGAARRATTCSRVRA